MLQRLCVGGLIVLALVACGGGGGASEPVVPPAINATPLASAGAAQTVLVGAQVTLDGSASSDPDGDAISHSWALTGKPAGSAATLSGAATARPSFTPDKEGGYTASLTVSDGRLQSTASSVAITATMPPTPPSIALDQTEPLSGIVKLSLTGTVTGSVTWYADLRLLGAGAASDANSFAWNTTDASNGEHQLLARIQTGTAPALELKQTVRVSNSSVSLRVTVSGTTGNFGVDVRASSIFGITAVSAKLDGIDIGTLSSPNACGLFCNGTNNLYRFIVNATQAGSGQHTMLITGTDAAGGTKQISVPVPISNAPVLDLSAPVDGAFAFGKLRLAGSVSSDKPGSVTVTASLGDVLFLQSDAASFSGSYDLAGLTPGAYTLTVRATDSTNQLTSIQRSMVVASSSALAYLPSFTLPSGGQLLAAEHGKALYSAADGTVVVRELGSGAEVSLSGAAGIEYVTGWRLDGGRVYAYGRGTDCIRTFSCIYTWDDAGTRRNLSNANPFAGTSYQLHPVAHDGQVIWANDANSGSYSLYDVVAGSYIQVAMPGGIGGPGNDEYDFAVVGGIVNFFYWASNGGEQTALKYDVYRWKSNTQTSVKLTDGASRNVYPQTDGVRVAWRQFDGSNEGPMRLLSQAVAGGPITTVSTTMTDFLLKDGVLAWVEGTNGKMIKAATPRVTNTLSILSTAKLYAAGGGQVVYGEQGKVYSWNSSTDTSKLRLEAAPSKLFISAGAVTFSLGVAVYRVTLD